MTRRHHVVSRGYQRLFADGERITLIEKTTLAVRDVGTRDAFVERGFNSYRVNDVAHDDLEEEWARLESPALAEIRGALRSGRPDAAATAVKVLMSIHIARSYFVRRLHNAYFAELLLAPTQDMDRQALLRAFNNDFGRTPSDAELEALVANFLLQRFDSNVFFVERMADLHNTIIREWLAPLHLQIGTVDVGRAEFVIGDSPVIRAGRWGLQVNAPLGDARFLMMPLSPRVIACLTRPAQANARLDAPAVQRVNSLMWRGCERWLACRPGSSWRLSLGRHVPPDS